MLCKGPDKQKWHPWITKFINARGAFRLIELDLSGKNNDCCPRLQYLIANGVCFSSLYPSDCTNMLIKSLFSTQCDMSSSRFCNR
mmetsp:Transcript_20495/g.30428  ORF Transcript_20495/g.30428 Transcript_20495/m.30428 type:complete len:85 (-) Transcript_20495:977-1231(-)